jgi:perosamine synthetase
MASTFWRTAPNHLGRPLDGRPSGSFGHAATFSFFGNKTVTTGEGGMVVTDDAELADHLRRTKGQGQDPNRRYFHDRLGFNYRMTNIAAAIGCAQMERLDQILSRKAAISALYRQAMADLPLQFQAIPEGVESSHWLVSVLVPEGIDPGRRHGVAENAGH